jgi:hypothetical protein
MSGTSVSATIAGHRKVLVINAFGEIQVVFDVAVCLHW